MTDKRNAIVLSGVTAAQVADATGSEPADRSERHAIGNEALKPKAAEGKRHAAVSCGAPCREDLRALDGRRAYISYGGKCPPPRGKGQKRRYDADADHERDQYRIDAMLDRDDRVADLRSHRRLE
jgi:hypothetical protein